MDVVQIPVLNDNYIYLVHDPASGETAVVDPAICEPVLQMLRQRNWELTYVLNTHHHWDHIGGNLELKAETGCKIVGHRKDASRIPGIDIEVEEGDSFELGSLQAEVMDVSGHTRGHIAYYFEKNAALFCGDTIFSIGCGRLFEGAPSEMWASLEKLIALPGETKIYCAHEYTASNCKFARHINPSNAKLLAYCEDVARLRASGKPTIPAQLSRELECNPFLRPLADDLIADLQLSTNDAVQNFAKIRKLKDDF